MISLFFPERRIILSVGVRFPGEFDANASEAEIRDLCISDARGFLTNFNNKAEFFNVTRKPPDAVIEKSSGDASMQNADFEGIGTNSGLLKVGQMDDGGYAVVVGGIVNKNGEFEKHGRWLPYPILVPMMVGTALSIEKEYLSSDAAYEIGELSQNMLKGDFQSKERIVLLLGSSSTCPQDESYADGRAYSGMCLICRQFLICPPLFECETGHF